MPKRTRPTVSRFIRPQKIHIWQTVCRSPFFRVDAYTNMLSPSKQKILIVGQSGIPQNPYPAFETINLSLNHSATSLAIFGPLVLPQPNVLIVSKKMPPPKKGGLDLGLTKPQDLPPEQSYNLLEGAGDKKIKSTTENMFLHPIKVYFNLSKITFHF